MLTSEKTINVLKSLFALKKDLLPVTKGEDNPFFKSRYADLNTHLDAVEPLASANGLLLTQSTGTSEVGLNYVETRLTHVESGEFVAARLTLVLGKQNMQDMGSAVTYARRYTLGSLLGMKAVDDDGNLASGKEVVKNYGGVNTNTAPTTTAKSSFRKAKKTDVNTTAAVVATMTQMENGGNGNGGWE